ncbi:MAG: hypothetical protein R2911_11995 [Caldilineaceae bacterium]
MSSTETPSPNGAAKENSTAKEEAKKELTDQLIETTHAVSIGGQQIDYTATTGVLVLKDEEDKAKASIFFTAYTRNGVADLGQRPITFAFNGGPGSSSVWLHMGVLGPKRVLMDDEGNAPPPPYRLVDNEYSILDKTDLVFIDPVSTGYSRPAPGEEAKQFHGLEKDIESVGAFIRLYTTRYKRWASPKFLIGESYGTTRSAGLAGHLQDRHGMYLNGIMLISSILNFQTARFNVGNDLPYILFLPTYTATAWYHGLLRKKLQKQSLRAVLDEVEEFAANAYTLALMKGAKLGQDERSQIVEKLAQYTGLSADYIERTNLRIAIHRFVKEILRPQQRTVGRFDTRITGVDRDAVGEVHEYDPSFAVIHGVYTAMFNNYVRTELGFESDLVYEILTSLYQTWDYGKNQNQYVNVAETLRGAMTKNRYLKVFVGNGYYDLATPYFATEYTFNHLGLDAELQANISMGHYEAGHMMYVHKPSIIQLKQDLDEFIEAALPQTQI